MKTQRSRSSEDKRMAKTLILSCSTAHSKSREDILKYNRSDHQHYSRFKYIDNVVDQPAFDWATLSNLSFSIVWFMILETNLQSVGLKKEVGGPWLCQHCTTLL